MTGSIAEACLWCGVSIPAKDAVRIERLRESEQEHDWEASFCGNEHAALWVADPTEPPELDEPEDWRDRLFDVAFYPVVAFGVVSFVVGAVVVVDAVVGFVR